jgi:hypothetical protein
MVSVARIKSASEASEFGLTVLSVLDCSAATNSVFILIFAMQI